MMPERRSLSEINFSSINSSTNPTTTSIPLVIRQDDIPEPVIHRNVTQKPPYFFNIEAEYEKLRQRRIQEQERLENKYKKTEIRKSDEDNIICLAVDGYESASFSYNITIREFLDKINGSLICIYIFNNLCDEEYNWKYKKEFVMNAYKTKLLTKLPENRGYFVVQNKNSFLKHPIQQIDQISRKNKCDYLFMGYTGLKTGNFKKENIRDALDYLLCENYFPTILFKEEYLRGKNNQGYKWLIVLDRANNESSLIIDYFLPLMDFKKDFIFGFSLLPRYIREDNGKKNFSDKMDEIGIDKKRWRYKTQYYSGEKNDKLSDIVKEFVNFNEEIFFNFVVFYNYSEKYKYQREKSESLILLEKISANICFVNTQNISNEKYLKMIKHKKDEECDVLIYQKRIE